MHALELLPFMRLFTTFQSFGGRVNRRTKLKAKKGRTYPLARTKPSYSVIILDIPTNRANAFKPNTFQSMKLDLMYCVIFSTIHVMNLGSRVSKNLQEGNLLQIACKDCNTSFCIQFEIITYSFSQLNQFFPEVLCDINHNDINSVRIVQE